MVFVPLTRTANFVFSLMSPESDRGQLGIYYSYKLGIVKYLHAEVLYFLHLKRHIRGRSATAEAVGSQQDMNLHSWSPSRDQFRTDGSPRRTEESVRCGVTKGIMSPVRSTCETLKNWKIVMGPAGSKVFGVN